MIIKHGDLFNSTTTYIGHGVNCQGVMGAGIAKRFKEEFPNNYRQYKVACHAATNPLRPGDILVVRENGRLAVNFATQDQPGADATYDSVFDSFFKFSVEAGERVSRNGRTVAIPQIGCGIGGLEWKGVEKIIETVEFLVPAIEYEVWIYE